MEILKWYSILSIGLCLLYDLLAFLLNNDEINLRTIAMIPILIYLLLSL